MSRNDAAKLHTRYLVGGRAKQPPGFEERLFRCRFPERPGALEEFLRALPPEWNISLFHYRNHGSAFGRVLVGLQIPVDSGVAVGRFVARLSFEIFEESDNAALSRFLST